MQRHLGACSSFHSVFLGFEQKPQLCREANNQAMSGVEKIKMRHTWKSSYINQTWIQRRYNNHCMECAYGDFYCWINILIALSQDRNWLAIGHKLQCWQQFIISLRTTDSQRNLWRWILNACMFVCFKQHNRLTTAYVYICRPQATTVDWTQG